MQIKVSKVPNPSLLISYFYERMASWFKNEYEIFARFSAFFLGLFVKIDTIVL